MMNQEHDVRVANSTLKWLGRHSASFVGGFIAGRICIPLVHYLIYSNTDPFKQGWPVCLETTTFLSAFAITMVVRCPTASALGTYFGLVGFMLISGIAEYPVASAIGLAIHGLLPAALGSAAAMGLTCQLWKFPVVVNPARGKGRPGQASQTSPNWRSDILSGDSPRGRSSAIMSHRL